MSRNLHAGYQVTIPLVTPRERRVSRNGVLNANHQSNGVTPRERRVSRNPSVGVNRNGEVGHASREACE